MPSDLPPGAVPGGAPYGQPDKAPQAHQLTGIEEDGKGGVPYEELECLINGDYTVNCRKEGSEVYLPFSFLQSYFEVSEGFKDKCVRLIYNLRTWGQ